MVQQDNRVILFGGTFDPPHVGHLLMAQLALEQSAATTVWFLPSPSPPHKRQERVTDYQIRKEMVAALIYGYDGLVLTPFEEQLDSPYYTVDTVHACQSQFPGHRFVFLIGSDSLIQLPTWKDTRTLTHSIEFLVAARSGYPYYKTLHQVQQALPGLRAKLLEMPLLDVSSSFLRPRLLAQKPTCGLVPDAVLEVWKKWHEQ
ncbi:nicotinate (nicotinamide) nucleotide adenylyltransferase [Alicyclobacillaceae bacterium I2511]|nr:nicotinate (nicotinamide) nucleotide adenylyltransferase [Alicyclobacillaceae bacterium I2511]